MTITLGQIQDSFEDTAEQEPGQVKAAAVLPPSDVTASVAIRGTFGMASERFSTATDRGVRVKSPIVRTPNHGRNRRFLPLARWEGAVIDRFDTYFVAEVIDLDNNERAIAEFDLMEVSESDRALCEPGSLFYWTIGYDIKESGQRSRASVIRFRRLGGARVGGR